MTKPIKLEPFKEEIIKELMEQVAEKLTERGCNNVINFKVDLKESIKARCPKEAATIVFTPHAFMKMYALVHGCDHEIAAHGIVTRVGNVFTITDILPYPQKVAHAEVESDDKLYGPWLTELPDEAVNHLRFQMHSHVNMSVRPSGTDHKFYDELLQVVPDFYIFMIVNKSGDMFINLYDIVNNLLYDEDDVVVGVAMPNVDVFYEEWADDMIKEMCTKIRYTKVEVHTDSDRAVAEMSGRYTSFHDVWEASRNTYGSPPVTVEHKVAAKGKTPAKNKKQTGIKKGVYNK